MSAYKGDNDSTAKSNPKKKKSSKKQETINDDSMED